MKKKTCMTALALSLTLLGTAGSTISAYAYDLTDKAQQVINGSFGNGQDRKDRLGKDYDHIQSKVNELLALDVASVVPAEAKNTEIQNLVNQCGISTASVIAQTQYSHTENGHVQGGYYAISSSTPSVTASGSGKTISGTVYRGGIGLEKGSITLAYVLNFDATGVYTSGSVTSSGYVDASINLAIGQNYAGQSTSFLSTTGGHAGSGSYIYPITATLKLV